jgi:hypothetical protein
MFECCFIHDFYAPGRDVALCFCHSCIRSFERPFRIWGLELLVAYRFYVLNNYFRLGFSHCISLCACKSSLLVCYMIPQACTPAYLCAT